jgi:hypothetical protein
MDRVWLWPTPARYVASIPRCVTGPVQVRRCSVEGCSLFRPESYGLPATGTPAVIGEDRVTIGVATRDRRCELER